MIASQIQIVAPESANHATITASQLPLIPDRLGPLIYRAHSVREQWPDKVDSCIPLDCTKSRSRIAQHGQLIISVMCQQTHTMISVSFQLLTAHMHI